MRSFLSFYFNTKNFNPFQANQNLTYAEIESIRETKSDSKEIIGTIVANSTTFNEKTEFSQEKYLKRKEKKYFEYVQIRKPTLRLIAHIFYRQDPERILGLRIDSLSQLISYAGVNSSGKYLLYDSSSSGLATAAFLNSIGPQGDAKVLCVQSGPFSYKHGVTALNLSKDHLKKCVGVNVYTALRQFYQETEHDLQEMTEEVNGTKRKNTESESEETPCKKIHLEDESPKKISPKRSKWQIENREAVEMLKEKFDSLTIVTRDDPFPIAKELLPFVHPGRQIVIFHTCKEILQECYMSLKQLNSIVNLRLFSTFLRNMQVLPKRTHPFVQIQGSSGYLLVGYFVNSN